jgi:hypothetical protein
MVYHKYYQKCRPETPFSTIPLYGVRLTNTSAATGDREVSDQEPDGFWTSPDSTSVPAYLRSIPATARNRRCIVGLWGWKRLPPLHAARTFTQPLHPSSPQPLGPSPPQTALNLQSPNIDSKSRPGQDYPSVGTLVMEA